MYQVLNETTMKTLSQMHAEHAGLALLMADPKRETIRGMTYPPKGKLYAIADEAGLDALHAAARELSKCGVKTLTDNTSLWHDRI